MSLVTLQIVAVVTQPARPAGRNQVLSPTPVEIWAKAQKIPVFSFPHNNKKPWLFENEQTVIDTLEPFKADLIVSASFGQKIPIQTIRAATFGGLNVHPSLLPKWRGADPVPWAILSGDHQTGVTIVTLEEKFDEGKIIAQQKYPITDKDTSDPLRTKLFQLGADLLVNNLSDYCSLSMSSRSRLTGGSGDLTKTEIVTSSTPRNDNEPYARRLTRDDGFEPWEKIQNPKEAERIDRKFRALHPWPGLWTEIKEKRLKILSCHLNPSLILDTVQLEGKKPVSYEQFAKVYLPS